MALTKVTTKGITDSAVTTDKIAPANVTTAKIGPSAVESSEINDGTVTTSDLASTLDLSSKTVTLPAGATATIDQNIALLGFKMAVNDGLTVFNLVDGVVDEFHDESGTDEAEGSNDLYNSTDDFYINSTQPQGVSTCISAGFSMTTITEPDTSTVGTNPTHGSATYGAFTVPTGVTSVSAFVFGAGGGRAAATNAGGAGGGLIGDAGGLTTEQVNGVGTVASGQIVGSDSQLGAGGGDQEQGGQAASYGYPGSLFTGGLGLRSTGGTPHHLGGGGAGYYGGGGGVGDDDGGGTAGSGGGGSSFYGHPQITSGSTEEGAEKAGGGTTQPGYVSSTNEGGCGPSTTAGEDGYVLITGSVASSATSTAIV